MEKKPSPPPAPGGSLIVKCKDFCVISLDFLHTEELNNVALSLESLSSIGIHIKQPTELHLESASFPIDTDNQVLYYPFFYQPAYSMLEDGWTSFRPEVEFSKLVLQQPDDWRISYVNKDFSVCPTYPSAVVVPKSIDDQVLMAAASFRQGGRFPVLSYRHEGGAVLMRSSQPHMGPNVRRCREDEKLLNSVLKPGMRGYIIDTRQQNATQTPKVVKSICSSRIDFNPPFFLQSKGMGGFETESHYPQWRRIHKPVERLNSLLDSLSKMVEGNSLISKLKSKF